jgi:hypothetical protein
VSGNPDIQPTWPLLLKTEKVDGKESLINSYNVHLGPRTGLPDTILKGDHQRIILAKLESNCPSSLRGKKIKCHPPFLFLATVAMLVGCLDCRTQF